MNLLIKNIHLRNLLLSTVLFACVCGLICFFSNWLFCDLLMSESLLNRSEKQIETNLMQTKIIAVGDSHPTRAINTKIIHNSFNYGSHGENYIQTYYKLKKTLQKNNNVQLVLLQMDLHNFYDKFQENDNLYFWKDYINPIELGEDSGTTLRTYFSYLLKGNFISYLSGLSIVFESFVRGNSEILVKGFQPKLSLRKLDKDYLQTRVNGHFNKDEEYLSERSVKYFYKILDLLKKKNIQVALVKYPVSKYYYNAAVKIIDEKAFNELLENTKERYSNIGMFLDYSKAFFHDDMNDLKRSLFYDHDHVNIRGANIISTHICKQIESRYHLCH